MKILSDILVKAGVTVQGTITGNSIVKSGGTSSQFLKADGSVDSSVYATQAYVNSAISIPSGQIAYGTGSGITSNTNFLYVPMNTGTGVHAYLKMGGYTVFTESYSASNAVIARGMTPMTTSSQFQIINAAVPASFIEVGGGGILFGVNKTSTYIFTSQYDMQLANSGNLLLGTTTDAGYKLDVNGGIRASNYVYAQSKFVTDDTGGLFAIANVLRLGNSNGANEVARINGSGNFLIGTTTDQGYKFTVNGDSLFFGPSSTHSVLFGYATGNAGRIVSASAGWYLRAETGVPVYIGANGVNGHLAIATSGAITATSSITAASFIKSGGTSSQFLKADGSVDSNTYATVASLGNYVTYTGATADLQMGNRSITLGDGTGAANHYISIVGNDNTGYVNVEVAGQKTKYASGGIVTTDKQFGGSLTIQLRGGSMGGNNYTIAFPYANGTVALTSQLSAYVPTSRTITINGTAYDLSADRSWTISSGTNSFQEYLYTATAGQTTFAATYTVGQVQVFYNGSKLDSSEYTATNGTSVVLSPGVNAGDIINIVAYQTGAGIGYGSLSATGPLTYNNGTGVFGIQKADSIKDGYLSSTDWSTFNNKLNLSGGTLTGALTGTSATFSGTVTTNGILVNNADVHQASTVGVYWGAPLTYLIGITGNTSSGKLSFITGSSTRLTLDGSGNLGIGLTSPQSQVQMNGVLTFSEPGYDSVRLHTIAHSHSSGSDVNNWMTFNLSNGAGTTNTVMRLNGAGNVGIGVSPQWNLSTFKALEISNTGLIYAGSGQAAFVNNGYYDGVWRYKTNDYASLYTTDSGSHVWSSAPSGTAGNQLSWIERARINNNGYFKASPDSSYYSATGPYHEFNSSAAGTNNTLFINRTTNNPYGPWIYFPNVSPNNTTQYFLAGSDSTQDKFFIYSNGNIVNRNNSYGVLSDSSLKENIVDATPKLSDLIQLKVRNFNFIGDESKQIGFIAQEFEKVFPSMIDTDDRTNLKMIKTSVLTPMVVKAIQEEDAKVEELRAIVAKQQEQIDSLKAQLGTN